MDRKIELPAISKSDVEGHDRLETSSAKDTRLYTKMLGDINLLAQDDEAFARQQYEAPQGEMEETLADIWRELLSIDRISRHDNFFALGGDSLLVLRLLVHLKQIGHDTTVREVFDATSLAMLASMLTHYNYKTVTIPPNLITEDSTKITPDMLPLITLSQTDIDAIVAQVPGGVANIKDIYELTPLQKGILYHHLIAKKGDPYLLVCRLRFINGTSLEHYTDVLQQIIRRHDIMRTAIFWDGLSEPAQVVWRQVPSLYTEITLDESDKPPLEQLSQEFNPRRYRLDLTQAPLLRLIAARASEGSWVALQLMHHSIYDNSTLKRLQSEIHAIMNGKTEILETPAPFRSFVGQARLGIRSDEYKRFFTEMLGDIDEPTLPFGLSDIDRDGAEIDEAHLKLSQALYDQLRSHARNLRVSLASICHLAWAQVLAKASGREAVVFGTVLLGRLQAGDENNSAMGPMINTLPLRLDIDESGVEMAVRHIHVQLSALLAHEHVPLVLAQSCSGVPTSVPLFSALLNYRHNQKTEEVNMPLPGVNIVDIEERTNYPLTISLDDYDDSMCVLVQVETPISAARICVYMQQSLESLVDALTHTPKHPIRKLEVMPPDERSLILHTWNQITINQSNVCCLHQLFEAQVECDGSAVAVECEEETLSYSELNHHANQLAHYLISQGVKPDDRIAICVERSTTMIVAMLGILKSGCAYVPLDPVYSSKRLTNILLDADPVFLLADCFDCNVLANHQIPVIDLEKMLSDNFPIHNPDTIRLGLTTSHLAYIIYTSGSTGTPKGVMVEHRQVVRLFQVTHDEFGFNKQDKWCLFHSISFDVSVWEIWNALSYGNQLSIVPYKITRSRDEFYDWICINGITVLNQTPSAFKMLMRAENISSRLDRLRYIIFAGEELDPLLAKEWYEKYKNGGTILVNMYGITEITVHATSKRLESAENVQSVGRPLPDLRVYLLDSYGEPVLVGAEGEIYIGGAGVARGYLNRPELTAERFLVDPFSDIPAQRMYRSGDLARYLPDGNLVFLGRIDQQVKIRGFRIELGEIEARLVEHPNVREAVVHCYGNGSDARLVAYVVADLKKSLAQNLRTYLSKLLPDYMVPAAYVCLPSFPLTPNGKLDRRALPLPDDDAFARQQYEAPRGEMEETLADIWRELLSIDRISRHDNFFALGGHSLLIVKLLSQLRRIGMNTSVREVFDASSLVMLASTLTYYKAVSIPPNLITEDSTKITPDMLPLITLHQTDIDAIIAQIPGGAANIQDIYGLTSLQNGMLFHHLMTKEGDVYLMVCRLRFSDRKSFEYYTGALQQMIERHDILRTAIFWDGLSETAQVVLRQVPSLFTEITLDESGRRPLEQLSQEFNPRRYRLDLTQAPLLRLIAAPASEGSWVALLLMHHLIIDHSTLERLQTEIHAIMNGKIEMLKTPTPFRNFVGEARLGIRSDEHKRFFTEMLGDIDEPTLPFGLSDIDQDGAEINEAHLMLSQALNDQLRIHARNLRVSLASICHLAWAQVLAQSSGREAVVFSTVLLGRLQAGDGNNSTMGPMINTLPLRLDIDDSSVEIAVRRTHARLSALLAHEHAPLVIAQSCSGVPTGLPLFSALLNYRHNKKTEEVNASIPGVNIVDFEERTNYPINLSVEDDGISLGLTAQVISPISAVRICAYMQQALKSMNDAITFTPKKPVQKLRVVPSDERNLLLNSWNQTTITNLSFRCLHQLFEAHVECDGQAIAVEFDGETLNYSELNIQANRLAHHLIAKVKLKPDDRIALCVERSTTMIVAMLGILKAGCAYLPLDPAYPSQRLTNILLDANPVFLLADATGHEVLADHQIPVIDLEKPVPDNLPIHNLDTIKFGITPANLAYIIYTSGSTGLPKGVMVEHQPVVQVIEDRHKRFGFSKQDKWCFFHSISFDISVSEVWGALCYGSQLSIVPYKITRSSDELYNWICTKGITVLIQTPSAFKSLIQAENIRSRSNQLRYVIFGGEALDSVIMRELNEKFVDHETIFVNMYGPTEAVMIATSWICDFQMSKCSMIPIGRPLSNKRIYLLDLNGEPVPLGAEGEIYIGGNELARGYLNRPILTAERFLVDPFSNDPAARMYRTGDLARYLPDGKLVFLGRIDQQVKIRGFRIELGEIEARLVEHPNVREAVVQCYGNGSDARLVAYVVADSKKSLAQNLRTYLSKLLPDYMVPAAYVCLPSLPLTPNGKLDRRALPAPDDEAFARQQYEAPQGEMEEKLSDIWRELLSIDRISRHDNFFALGGHSLLIVKLLSELRRIGMNTSVREVFDASSLAMLASTLSHYKAITIPPNLITKDSTEITPDMLPLITLSQTDIDAIVAQVPGGVGNIQDIYGLTSLQKGILFHHLMTKAGDVYLTVSRLRFSDRKSIEYYTDALQQIIRRHDILRTAIFWDGLSEPAQVVLRQVSSLYTEITLDESDKPPLEQLSQEFNPRRYRLDLTQAPLLRLIAARASEGSWVALHLMHHSIIDHLSLERLQTEIHAIMNGKIEMLTTPSPFRSFVGQARLGMRSDEHKRFFTEMLGDIDEPTLPFGLSDIDRDGAEIDEVHFKLSQALNVQLRAHARNLRVSLASICHLAWAQVLARATGREAVVFGTVLLGRLQAGDGSNSAMGPMINTLPLRLDIDESGVEVAVRRTHARLSALLAHEHAPLVLAQSCSGVPTSLPLFSALLNYRHNQKTEEVTASLPGVSIVDSEERTNYPLTLSVEDDGSSLGLRAQVITPLSAVRICAYMQQALKALVDALAQYPHLPLETLEVIPLEERTLLVHTWNQTTYIYIPRCLHEFFEVQIKHKGQAKAVECEGETLSYKELNGQANQLAHYLIFKGVKPDDRIALCVERSISMVVAMLGILKAGCAYVPLDPVYPSQRLTNILIDADPVFLLADATGRNTLGGNLIPVIELEKPLPINLPIDNPNAIKLGLTPVHLAYVIYTSGSTGIPKGVMVEHRNVTNCLHWIIETFTAKNFTHTSFSTSINFDMSLYECFAALSMGTTLHIISNALALSKSSNISMLSTVPSAMREIINADALPISLDTLHLIGEPLQHNLIKRIFKHTHITELYNLYGQTETSFFSTMHRFRAGNEIIETIGRPIANTRTYLLNAQSKLVLLGAEGEIYIGGANVARGYLNRTELTAERFLPDPFNNDPAARMFRTGDRARYLPDGNLVFLGRVDQQVKIRGFRIEPGEIEARLIEHPNVCEAVVQSYENGLDAKLIAYVVADTDPSLVENLRKFLSKLLPVYMVPAAYVCLPSLPLTPNGKLDRRALPAPDDEAFARQQYEAPQGGMEETLADIWRELLSIDRISRHDNFFALGGHSLLIVQLLSQLRQIGLNTSIREVFDASSLAMLASTLSHYKAVTIPPNLITKDSTEITPDMLPLITLSQTDIDAIVAQVPGGVANIQDIYGLTPLQHGMLLHHLMAKEGDVYLMVCRLRFTGRTSLERYTNAMHHVIERHDILRSAIFWDGLSEPAQVVLRQVPSLFTEITWDESDKPPLEQLSEIFNYRRYRLDLTHAPLIRLVAAPESEGSWVALHLIHHSIMDQSSLDKLLTEIYAIMTKKIETLKTPALFRNFMGRTRLGIRSDEHKRFFTEMLGDIDEPTLPFGLTNTGHGGAEINEAHLMLPQALNDQLRTHARNLRVSVASICHLAWAQVLARATGREAVVFGTVLLGRLQAGDGSNSAMGPMINTLPLRLDIDASGVEIAVHHAHARLGALLAHEDTPPMVAQRCSGVPTILPLFSGVLNYRHHKKIRDNNAFLPGVTYLDGFGQTQFPLFVSMDESDDFLSLTVQIISSISAARICAYMQQTLESLVHALTHTPIHPVRKLEVMPPDERSLLSQITVTQSNICCLHQFFETQVECDGKAVAVKCEGETLTYTELNCQANQLAHYMISRGVKPDERIALCVERSITMVVAMLGILKAGCAYVPLDPVYPSQRLTNILQDAVPVFLLADAVGLEVLGDHRIPVIDLEKPLSDNLPNHNPDTIKLGLTPSHLAYVIYTSGSTETPKGVMVEHQQVVRLFEATRNKFDFSKQDKWCLFHSISFDVSVWEIWNALSYGNQLSIVPYKITRSRDEFYDWICINGITVLNQTPSAFRMLMHMENNISRSDRLRYIIFAGEELNPLFAKAWYEKYDNSGTILVNMYGITEITVHATIQRLETIENLYSIGRPLPDRCVYILDSYGEPVLVGAEGEIYIGGAGVARGYLNHPELTAERFLPDPFSNDPAARMFRTGDRAKYLFDGNLVFLGRQDQQVKIRGFRIELGKIEACLVEHPNVHEAVVQSYGNKSDAHLVAYVVADTDLSLVENLRSYLLTLLPVYILPAAYVRLPSLPRTPNGKLDRRALPAPNDEAFFRQHYEAPQGEMEETLADIWRELLSIDRISRHDNFFALGGHPLMIVKLLSRLRQNGMNTSILEVFNASSLAMLASKLVRYKAVTLAPIIA